MQRRLIEESTETEYIASCCAGDRFRCDPFRVKGASASGAFFCFVSHEREGLRAGVKRAQLTFPRFSDLLQFTHSAPTVSLCDYVLAGL